MGALTRLRPRGNQEVLILSDHGNHLMMHDVGYEPSDVAGNAPTPSDAGERPLLPRLQIDQIAWRVEVAFVVNESEGRRCCRPPRRKYRFAAPDADRWAGPGSGRHVEGCPFGPPRDPGERANLAGHVSLVKVPCRLPESRLWRVRDVGRTEARVEAAPEHSCRDQRQVLDDERDA